MMLSYILLIQGYISVLILNLKTLLYQTVRVWLRLQV